MRDHTAFIRFVATALLCVALVHFGIGDKSHALAQDASLEQLMADLADPDLENWESVERQIWEKWSTSGSDAMDLLLKRGRDAMDFGFLDVAIGHFTALINHAPEFAEGWNARATAYYLDGQFGPSMADIQQVLALNPDHFGALTGMAMMLEETGQLDEALNVVERVLEVHPHRPDVLLAQERLIKATEGTAL